MKDIIKLIAQHLNEREIPFMIVGAWARDFAALHYGFPQTLGTVDVDIGIIVKSWEGFYKIKQELCEKLNFSQSIDSLHRIQLGNIKVDLLPFGEIGNPDFLIKWKEKFKTEMSIIGWDESFENAFEFDLDGLGIKVVSPDLLIFLKLISWHEGGIERERDAQDILFILENSIFIHKDAGALLVMDDYSNIGIDYNYDEKRFARFLMAQFLKSALRPHSLKKLKEILDGPNNIEKIAKNSARQNQEDAIEAILDFKKGINF